MTLQQTNALVSISDGGATAVAQSAGATFTAGGGDNIVFTLTNPPSPNVGVQWSVTLTFAGGDVSPPPSKTVRLDQGQTSIFFPMPQSYIASYTSTVTDASGTTAIATGTVQTTAGLGGIVATGAAHDPNSLILGDVADDIWTHNVGNMYNAPYASTYGGNTIDGYLDGVWINAVQANVNYILSTPFSAPAGVTAVQFEVDAALPTGVGSSTIVIAIYDVTLTTPLASTTVVLTATQTTYVAGPVAVTPGTNYKAVIFFGATNNGASASSSAMISRVRVKPTTTSVALLASPFIRYEAQQRLLWGNNLFGVSTSILGNVPMRRQSPYSRFAFWTNASQIAVQSLNTISAIVGAGVGFVVVHVNGRPWATFQGTNNVISTTVVNLPSGYNYIEVESSDQSNIDQNNNFGNVVLAVLAPQSAVFNVMPRQQPIQTIYWLYDSKGGFGATNPTLNGVIPLMRRSLPHANFVHDGAASRQVFNLASSFTAQQQTVARIVQAKPTTVVWYGLYRNDWAAGSFSPTQVRTLIETIVDAVHAACPETNFVMISTPSEGAEGANGLGFTLPNYRDACSKDVAAARPGWCTFIDGSAAGMAGWSNGTCLAPDGIHPNNTGYQVLYLNLMNNESAFGSPTQLGGIGNTIARQYQGTPSLAATTGAYAPVLLQASQIPNNTAYKVDCTAIIVDSAGNTGAIRTACLVQNKAGTVTIVGTPTVLETYTANATLTFAYSIVSGALVGTVTNTGGNTAHAKIVVNSAEPVS